MYGMHHASYIMKFMVHAPWISMLSVSCACIYVYEYPHEFLYAGVVDLENSSSWWQTNVLLYVSSKHLSSAHTIYRNQSLIYFTCPRRQGRWLQWQWRWWVWGHWGASSPGPAVWAEHSPLWWHLMAHFLTWQTASLRSDSPPGEWNHVRSTVTPVLCMDAECMLWSYDKMLVQNQKIYICSYCGTTHILSLSLRQFLERTPTCIEV